MNADELNQEIIELKAKRETLKQYVFLLEYTDVYAARHRMQSERLAASKRIEKLKKRLTTEHKRALGCTVEAQENKKMDTDAKMMEIFDRLLSELSHHFECYHKAWKSSTYTEQQAARDGYNALLAAYGEVAKLKGGKAKQWLNEHSCVETETDER